MNASLVSFFLLSGHFVFAAVDANARKNCSEFLTESSYDNYTFTIIENDQGDSYKVVQTPIHALPEEYITVYTNKGFTEMNPVTGACNSGTTKEGKKVNASTMLTQLFDKKLKIMDQTLDKMSKIRPQNMDQALILILATGFTDSVYKTFVSSCSNGFEDIKKHQLSRSSSRLDFPSSRIHVDPIPLPGAEQAPKQPERVK